MRSARIGTGYCDRAPSACFVACEIHRHRPGARMLGNERFPPPDARRNNVRALRRTLNRLLNISSEIGLADAMPRWSVLFASRRRVSGARPVRRVSINAFHGPWCRDARRDRT